MRNRLVPAGNFLVPARNRLVPAGNGFVPARNCLVLAGNGFVPAHFGLVPAGNGLVPTRNQTIPARKKGPFCLEKPVLGRKSTFWHLISAQLGASKVDITWGRGGNAAFLEMLENQADRGAGWTPLAFDTTPNYTDTTPFADKVDQLINTPPARKRRSTGRIPIDKDIPPRQPRPVKASSPNRPTSFSPAVGLIVC